MFKIALNAGHYLYTPGKRCLKSLDANETREWYLNSRICAYVTEKLKAYSGYELLRVDDSTGQTDRTVQKRTEMANNFGADIYVSVHHNAGVNGASGGGIMAFTYTQVGEATKKLQKLLYDKLIEKTGLKGNRAQPLSSANFAECRLTKMPAVLLECGFMDSSTDVPVILSELFAQKAAEGIVEAIAEYGNITKNVVATEQSDKMYYVQVGAFKVKKNADELAERLKAAGFPAFIKSE